MSMLLGERVVPKYSMRGLVSLGVLVGWAWALAVVEGASAWFLRSAYGGPTTPADQMVTMLVIVHVSLLPAAVAGAWLCRFTRRRAPVCFAILGMAVGACAYSIYSIASSSADAGVLQPWSFLAASIAMAVLGGVGVLIGLLFRWLTRGMVIAAVEQSEGEGLCWKCGYELGPGAAGRGVVCSECASPANSAKMRGRWLVRGFEWVQRLSRPVMALGGLAFVAWSVWTVWMVALPAERFRAALPKWAECQNPGVIECDVLDPSKRASGSVTYTPAMQKTWLAPDGSGRVILVAFAPRGDAWGVCMQIRVAKAQPVPPGLPAGGVRDQYDMGMPLVVSDLNREQAEQVIARGVPEGLMTALLSKADAVGWAPTNFAAPTPYARHVVDPRPFLDASGSTIP